MQQTAEPKGIPFFNTNSGETHYCTTEPMIAAYINSSDMGINASRGQDFGWKLGSEWVKKVREFRRNSPQMALLSARHSGQKPTTVQILFEMYGEELRAYEEQVAEESGAYLGQYQQDIAETPAGAPADGPGLNEIPEGDDELEIDTDAAAEAATSEPVKSKSQERREAIQDEAKPKQK